MPSKTKVDSSRFGIHEWFGAPATSLTQDQRTHNAAQSALSPKEAAMPCPCAQALRPGQLCNKKGGVCSIVKYTRDASGEVLMSERSAVTTCPSRFLDGGDLLRWASEVALGCDHPVAIKEIPFLESSVQATEGDNADDATSRKAGRIDWVLVNPSQRDRWCAVETQSVYFSGNAMDSEFPNWAKLPKGASPFPASIRRPDYRSSGPKRLAPQLQVKVPELRAWGAKTVVIVDEYFFGQMSALPEVRGQGDDRLVNAEVIWLVAGYESHRMVRRKVLYSRLDESVRALNATQSIGREAFIRGLHAAMDDPSQERQKVFRL